MPNGKYFATGTALSGDGDDKLHLWDSQTNQWLRMFGKFGNDISGLQFSPDSKLLAASVAGQRIVSLWSVPDGSKLWQTKSHSEASHLAVVFSPTGELLASCGDTNVAIWNVVTGKPHAILKGHEQTVRSIAFSADGGLLISSDFLDLRFWDVKSATCVGVHSFPHMNLIEMAFSPDGEHLTAVHTINNEVSILKFKLGAIPSSTVQQSSEIQPIPRSEKRRPDARQNNR